MMEITEFGEHYPTENTVCVTHKRFVPCRCRDGMCVFSSTETCKRLPEWCIIVCMPKVIKFTPDREQLAWAAGFYDGEGCVGCYRTGGRAKPSSLNMSVTQKGSEPLERFQRAVGLG